MKGAILDSVALVMHERDTVATALEDLAEGTAIETDEDADENPVTLAEDVPFGHKLALEAIDAGEPVYKYGERIGTATRDVAPGEWVHTHNCESTRGRGDLLGDDATEEGCS